MQVTSLLSQQDNAAAPEVAAQAAVQQKLALTAFGLLLVVNAYFAEWFLHNFRIASGSAMIGALILGWPIVSTSIRDLRRGQLGINELVSLAVVAAFATGDYKTAGLVAFFMLVGEIIESRTAAGARASIESLVRLTPSKARRITPAGLEEVPASELRAGDMLRVRPGDNIPADGVITDGASTVNQANITGESLPAEKKSGDDVFAGTINLTGVLDLRVTHAGQDTTLGRVRDLILAAEQTKLPIMRLMDQYMSFYTPLVLVMAALVWAFTSDLTRVISVLVVACPCAFILATPTAMVAAISAAARLGVLIKNIADLELAARINAFIFDKTGTLTTGQLSVARLAPVNGLSAAELLRLTIGAEQFSNHPTARAVARLAQEAGVPAPTATEFREAAGRGVEARVDGVRVLVGRAAWLREHGVPETALTADLGEAEGHSLLFVARDGALAGWLALRDETRSESATALRELTAAGVRRIAMVSGDRQPVAARVAKEVGCPEVAAECLPQDKVSYVRALKAKGYRVAVVGDGVNDAPALAAGDLGIAMGAAGSEVAIHSATIALMNSDLRRLPFLIELSRGARRVINQNLLIGVVFILGGLVMAGLGYLNPIIAAILHNAGSLLVVFNSARLVRLGEHLEPFTRVATTEPSVTACAPCANSSTALATQPA
ncbi:MAG: cadmium-translocating P-type ATPase [Verrucomicrobia bacterium]|nr:cadmium-translocating P-type ATPase [Verrucomicrobiota bacterium]